VTLSWVREDNPTWDADKERVIGGAPEGAFVLGFADGEQLPGEWWSARDGESVVGYGRLDVTWGGDAEILLAVDPAQQQHGVGSFVLARLEEEAAGQGINYVHNRIREHAERDLVHDWLVVRGFRGSTDADLRKRVGTATGTSGAEPASSPAASSATPYDAESSGDLAPGHEDQGGYVSVEDHQY
jgi:GNAT superfamily N-acetyltransferase